MFSQSQNGSQVVSIKVLAPYCNIRATEGVPIMAGKTVDKENLPNNIRTTISIVPVLCEDTNL